MISFLPVKFIKERHIQLFDLIKEHLGRLIIGSLCSGMMAATTGLSAWLIKDVVDDVFVNRNMTMLKILPVVIVALFLVKGFAYFGQDYFMNYVGQRIIKKLRDSLYVHIQDLPFSFF
nr:ABC transporter permease [Deltaproteobacteria bacterium]